MGFLFPEGFVEKYTALLESEAEDFFSSFEEEATKGFRINPLKSVVARNEEGIPHCSWGYYGKVGGKTIDHTTGVVYSQEPSAMFVGEVLHPKKGDKVLDLCAAPGGKSTHIASFLENTGFLVSNEIHKGRAKILAENCERFGIRNQVITNETPRNLAKNFPLFFDKILVDAPCSGEGMFRKDPEAIKYWNPSYPKECASLQKEILIEAVKMLKSGGELVYSTCTFSPEENEQVISWLLEEYPEFELLEVENKKEYMSQGRPEWGNGNPQLSKCIRLFPQQMQGEGHFVCKLRKNEDIFPPIKRKLVKGNISREQRELWDDFEMKHLTVRLEGELIVFGNHLYLTPKDMVDFAKLKIQRAGLHLGEFKKNRFEPSFTLGLALSASEVKHKVTLDEEEWSTYVSGNVVSLHDGNTENGWVQVVVNGNGLGLTKRVGNTLKNSYPKGLRFHL